MLYLAASITAAGQEDANLARDMHEGGRALEFAETISPRAVAALSAKRQANYLVDLTEAHAGVGKLPTGGADARAC